MSTKTAKKVAKATIKKVTKKVAKKVGKAAKKSVAKKSKKSTSKKKVTMLKTPATPKPIKQPLQVYKLAQDVPEKRYFVLANGRPIKNVAELAEILDELEDHIFTHHVNPERNDFHNWVKDVFKDVELAKKMLGVDSKNNLQLTIYKHVAHKAFEEGK